MHEVKVRRVTCLRKSCCEGGSRIQHSWFPGNAVYIYIYIYEWVPMTERAVKCYPHIFPTWLMAEANLLCSQKLLPFWYQADYSVRDSSEWLVSCHLRMSDSLQVFCPEEGSMSDDTFLCVLEHGTYPLWFPTSSIVHHSSWTQKCFEGYTALEPKQTPRTGISALSPSSLNDS